MAEGGLVEKDDTTVLIQASLTMKKKVYNVTLTEAHLTWKPENGKSDSQKLVRIRDIIAVNVETTPTSSSTHQLTVVYIQEQKGSVLKRNVATFVGEANQCNTICTSIQKTLSNVSERPKKLLVLINPISGRSRGQKVYNSKVAPVFKEASVETDVIVTERAGHAVDLMTTYDLKSVDGIVIVGGDGLYHEVSNGLAKRMASEAGMDVTKPDYVPPEFPLPVGLIPCGTGNGIAMATVGNYDFISAAYTIVLGYKTRNNLYSVFCGEEFMSYSSLLTGYGLWGDVIYATESRRSQGVLRYPIAMVETLLLRRHREMNLTVHYKDTEICAALNEERRKLFGQAVNESSPSAEISAKESMNEKVVKSKDEQDGPENVTSPAGGNTTNSVINTVEATECGKQESDKEKEVIDVASAQQQVTTNSEMTDYKTVQGIFTSLIAFADLDFHPCRENSKAKFLPDQMDFTALLLSRPGQRASFIKTVVQMIAAPGNLLCGTFPVLFASEWKVVLNNPSNPESENGRKEKLMNIDGEVFHLKKPEYSVKMFPERIPVYCNIPRITGRTSGKK